MVVVRSLFVNAVVYKRCSTQSSLVLNRTILLFRPFSTKNTRPLSGLLSAGNVLKLLERRKENKIILLDTVYQANINEGEFEKEHIPSAQYFDIEKAVFRTLTKRRNLRHPLDFERYVRSLGVNRDSFVVLYDHGETNRSILSATYSHWLFTVFGHQRVAVMNGGLTAWKSCGFPTEASPIRIPNPWDDAGNFSAGWNSNLIATFPDFLRNLHENSRILLDSRIPGHFSGETKMELAKHGGRVPTATNVPVAEFISEDERYLLDDKEKFINVLKNRNVPLENRILCYCNTAFQSSGLHFLLRQCGFDSKIYDGSWVEWSYLGPEKFQIRFTCD